MRGLLLGLPLLFLSCGAPAHAQSTQNCAPREVVVENLSSKYSENLVLQALSGVGLVEFFGNPNGSTWTMIVTYPTGTSCAVSVGEDYSIFSTDPDS